jgi:hypothetical protein
MPPEVWHSLKYFTIKNFFIHDGVQFDMSLDVLIDKIAIFEKEEEVAVMLVIV